MCLCTHITWYVHAWFKFSKLFFGGYRTTDSFETQLQGNNLGLESGAYHSHFLQRPCAVQIFFVTLLSFSNYELHLVGRLKTRRGSRVHVVDVD